MRLLTAVRTDVRLQARNQLYAISIGVAALCSGAVAWLSSPDTLQRSVPMALLMFVGGSTLLYVVAMVILERADGTLTAVLVSPLRDAEYLASKAITLTALATLEAALIALGTHLLVDDAPTPNAFLAVGVLTLGIVHVLAGIVIVVRYERIVEALIPMGVIATLMQLPALWFVGAIDHVAILAIPTGAPTMFLRAAYVELEPWQWAYALGGTTLTLAVLAWWSLAAFRTHVAGSAG